MINKIMMHSFIVNVTKKIHCLIKVKAAQMKISRSGQKKRSRSDDTRSEKSRG